MTDYDNYMISYNCVNLPGGSSEHTAWVAARNTELTDDVENEVNQIINKYFYASAFFKVYQKDDFCSPRAI